MQPQANRIEQHDDNGTGTALTLRGAALPSVFDRISDPMAFITTMGKSLARAGVGGAKNEAQGECLALACLCKRMDPFEFSAQYHLIDGKPQLQAHAILARMKKAGAKVRWLNDGEDLTEAVAEFDIENEKTTIRYSMDNAKKSGSIRSGSAWEKSPAAMLRAAMTRKAAKMLMPEILVGDVDPEEFASDDRPATTVVLQRSSEEIERRRAELESTATVSTEAAGKSTATATTEEAPFDATESTTTAGDMSNDITAVLMEIELTLSAAGQNKSDIESKLGRPLDALSLDGAKTLLGRLRDLADKSQKK